MALLGNDFTERVETRTTHCSECGRKIRAGGTSLVSIKYGKVQKRVCSEECRQNFDDAIWQHFADKHQGVAEDWEGTWRFSRKKNQ